MLRKVASEKEQERKHEKNKERYLGKLVLERNGYVCHRILGRGAFSQVYWVEKTDSGKLFACKVSVKADLLEREAEVMHKLKAPLFPAYGGFWKEAGLGFLLSEFVAGCTMEEMLRRRGGFSMNQTIRVGLALAKGLKYLHEREERYLFRDVKPANVMIAQDGSVKLIDFGCVCSRGERNSSRAGTPGFAAPEQLARGKKLTPACDVYGLGRTLEAMLGARRLRIWNRRERRLRRFLRDCTRADRRRRIPDMNGVLATLGKLKENETEVQEISVVN